MNVGIHWDRSRISLDKLKLDCENHGLNLKWIQIFTHGPRNMHNNMKPKVIDILKNSGLDIYVHVCYVCGFINTECLVDHMLTADIIGAKGIVLHIPSNMRDLDELKIHLRELDREAHQMGVKCTVYLENSIYKYNDHIDRLTKLMKYTRSLKCNYGICIDTCHLNESGFDVNENLDKIIKFAKYDLIFHLNDSNGDGRDYHQHLGHHIWKHNQDSLNWILQSGLPFILERSNIGYLPDLRFLEKINK